MYVPLRVVEHVEVLVEVVPIVETARSRTPLRRLVVVVEVPVPPLVEGLVVVVEVPVPLVDDVEVPQRVTILVEGLVAIEYV